MSIDLQPHLMLFCDADGEDCERLIAINWYMTLGYRFNGRWQLHLHKAQRQTRFAETRVSIMQIAICRLTPISFILEGLQVFRLLVRLLLRRSERQQINLLLSRLSRVSPLLPGLENPVALGPL